MSRILRLAFAILCAAGCSRPAPAAGPQPAHLCRVPEGFGRPFEAANVLAIRDRQLFLPGGASCQAGSACAVALKPLGHPMAVEIDRTQRMGDLSAPLASLSDALGAGDTACLVAWDASGRRCIPFRPFSGDEFSAWLDADKPIGKIRVVMRADGLEVVADRGKVPGPDRHGPSLPTIGGSPDLSGLDRLLTAVANRFPDEEEAGLAASPATPVEQAVLVLAALNGPGGGRFKRTFLVYP